MLRKYRTRRLKYKYIKVPLAPGELVEIDVKYAPEKLANRRYFQFTAIDCATRWRYLKVYQNIPYQIKSCSLSDSYISIRMATSIFSPLPRHQRKRLYSERKNSYISSSRHRHRCRHRRYQNYPHNPLHHPHHTDSNMRQERGWEQDCRLGWVKQYLHLPRLCLE